MEIVGRRGCELYSFTDLFHNRSDDRPGTLLRNKIELLCNAIKQVKKEN